MELQLVTFTQAKKLKELGFNLKTYDYYDKNDDGSYSEGDTNIKLNWNENQEEHFYVSDDGCSAPTIALALKWFRDVKGVENAVETRSNNDWTTINYDSMWWHPKDKDGEYFRVWGIECPTYEEAESSLLDALLEYCENNKEEVE